MVALVTKDVAKIIIEYNLITKETVKNNYNEILNEIKQLQSCNFSKYTLLEITNVLKIFRIMAKNMA